MKISLKAARVNKGLTQKKAGDMIGVTEDTISNWERGKSYPDALYLKRLEAVYEISYNDIIFLPRKDALSVKGNKRAL